MVRSMTVVVILTAVVYLCAVTGEQVCPSAPLKMVPPAVSTSKPLRTLYVQAPGMLNRGRLESSVMVVPTYHIGQRADSMVLTTLPWVTEALPTAAAMAATVATSETSNMVALETLVAPRTSEVFYFDQRHCNEIMQLRPTDTEINVK